MKKHWSELQTDETERLAATLRKHFAQVDAYRAHSTSIKLRIIDPRFSGQSAGERSKLVRPVVEPLARELLEDPFDLDVIVELAPEEQLDVVLQDAPQLERPVLVARLWEAIMNEHWEWPDYWALPAQLD